MKLPMKSVIFLLLTFIFFYVCADTIPEGDHESRDLQELKELSAGAERTKYQITARVFPGKREVEGVEIIRWTNRSGSDVDSLRLNLFYNAFKDTDSTFFSETSAYKYSEKKINKYKFGGIELKKIEIINRNENISGELTFLTSDDQNNRDMTYADFSLKKPVSPGQTIWIKVEFKLKIPDIFYKTATPRKDFYP